MVGTREPDPQEKRFVAGGSQITHGAFADICSSADRRLEYGSNVLIP